ncbi:MAG: hypothetical protein CMM99_05040 [Rickettsiales bacterium]|nr:hypothetical protein [Rickettsiales bacterium]
MSLNNFINLIRYKSYLKNLIIFLPLFLNYTSWSVTNYGKLILPAIFFSFLASSIYIINDLKDLETDKKHKFKKFRPLASGLIESKSAVYISFCLASMSFFYFFIFTDLIIFLLVTLYFILNLFYSTFIKKIKYLDILIVSSGFFIRIYIGSIITDLAISNFFISQIILFSMFILICKRREDFYSYSEKIVSKYSIKELNLFSKIFLILNILNYLIYFFYGNRFTDSYSLEISLMIFIFLIVRYFIINSKNKNFDPISIFLKDKYLILLSFIYFFNFTLGFYGFY